MKNIAYSIIIFGILGLISVAFTYDLITGFFLMVAIGLIILILNRDLP